MLRKLRVTAEVISSCESVSAARRLILPGIGAFDACMEALQRPGLAECVAEFASTGRPLLGICVGMQMLTLGSEEGDRPGLGLIDAETRRFLPVSGLRIPHMGWDTIQWMQPEHPLSRNLLDENRFYFVHSFCVTCRSPANSLAMCIYGQEFSAVIASGNVAGVQF